MIYVTFLVIVLVYFKAVDNYMKANMKKRGKELY